ncbi:S1/P1 nuclease [Candidatus Cloacimonadota bacterium]
MKNILVFLLILPVYLSAWNSTGHMIVAAIAFDQLDTETQLFVRDALRNHPEYENWMEEIPEGYNEGAYLMMKASLWPDEIRRSDNIYDHPTWHYVNFFIHRESGEIDTVREDPQNDIIWGIEKSAEFIKSEDPTLTAVYLSWLNHLVADIHQPMHCCSVISEKSPEGDRGGNRHWVKNNGEPIKLHFYWDMLPGRISDLEDVKNAVVMLTDYFPDTDFSVFSLSDDSAYEWALESLNISYESVHQKLTLPEADNPNDAHPLTDEYHTMAQDVYKQRIMIAAYRLKETILSVTPGKTNE